MQEGHHDVRYMEILHRLQQGDSTSTGTGISTCSGISTCGSTSVDAQAMDYCVTTDGLVRFRDRICIPDKSELKKVILREFHAKPYSGHLGYQKTLIVVKRYYYWPNLKRDVVEFVARCFECQQVKVECKHPGRLYSQS